MKEYVKEKLSQKYTLVEKNMNELTTIRKGMYRFDCEAYEIKDIGNLFFISMKAMFGLMKMETIVVTPLHKDLSFCNFDIVNFMKQQTYIFEMYESSIEKADLSSFDEIAKRYSHLGDYASAPRWYDELKLSSCLAKKGKNISKEADRMIKEMFDNYLELLDKVPDCDPDLKAREVKKYVDRLINEGGAAVDNMNKIIGKDKTEILIRTYMYGV